MLDDRTNARVEVGMKLKLRLSKFTDTSFWSLRVTNDTAHVDQVVPVLQRMLYLNLDTEFGHRFYAFLG